MAITPEQIDEWIGCLTEHQQLEFKEAKSGFGHDKLYAYCAAIHNEKGGLLVLGVTDKNPRKVVGTNAYLNTVKIAELLLNKLRFRVDIEIVNHPEGRVLVFDIPSRPLGTPFPLDGAFLMRSGESLVAMTSDHLRKIFEEGKPDWLEEISKTGLNAQQVIDLLDVQTFFDLLKIPHPTDRDGVIERLKDEKIIDEIEGDYAIRRIGAILFAKQIKDFPDIERKAATRIIFYNDISKVDTKFDREGTKGYAVNFQALIRFITAQLPQNQIIKDALRQEVKLVPEIVIRELIANALIHQDFTIPGCSVMIELYANRIEISNPGDPIVPVERFIDGIQSRNERLAGLMRRMGICEEKGSGIDRVMQAVEVFQLPAPDFRTGHLRTAVIIYGPKRFDNLGPEERIRACYWHCALKWVMDERMTNSSLRERFKLSSSKSRIISQVINATVDKHWIKADQAVGSSRKYARYLPAWA